MSETTRTVAKTKEDKVKKDKDKSNSTVSDPDPYCCTPGDGGTGADTKP